MRYDNHQGRYGDDFDPATYRERTEYDPDMIIARYYLGLVRRRAREFFEPVYGTGPDVSGKVARDNPADVLAATDLRPGELAIYVNYPSATTTISTPRTSRSSGSPASAAWPST